MSQYRNQKGFTLIELLVVIAIIGLLSSVILVGMNNARTKSRDARRLTDMQQVRSGMDLYYSNGAGYPATAVWTGGSVACSGTTIMATVPKDPLNTGTNVYTYNVLGTGYTGCGGTVYPFYYLTIVTEATTSLGAAGTYYISPKGASTTVPTYP
jgi:prepilin-type N-terminal cleavage/methylation domain-containing protein